MHVAFQYEKLPPFVVSGTYDGPMRDPGKVLANLFSPIVWRLITEVFTDALVSKDPAYGGRLSDSSDKPSARKSHYDFNCASCFLTSSASLYLGSIFKVRSKCCFASAGCSALA